MLARNRNTLRRTLVIDRNSSLADNDSSGYYPPNGAGYDQSGIPYSQAMQGPPGAQYPQQAVGEQQSVQPQVALTDQRGVNVSN